MNLKKKLTLSGAALLTAFSIAGTTVAHASSDLTGCLIKSDSSYTYIKDGKTDKGEKYQQLPNIYSPKEKGWYLTKDGKALDGVQDWAGSKWYFEPTTKQLIKHRDYVKGQDGKYHMVDKDGRVLSGIQEWQGSYWYFDKDGVLITKRNYVKSQWGMWYLVGSDGRVQSGLQEWAGSYWYFDPTTYLLVKNKDITVDGVSYHADKDGRVTKNANQETGFDPSEINWTYELGAGEGDSRLAIPDYIILHEVGAESGAAANANYLKNNWTTANTTFVVGDGGQVFCVSDPGYVSWGALDANPYAPVQIELGRTWNRAQFLQDYAKYIAVARYYSNYYGIPTTLDDGGVGTKGDKSHRWVSRNMSGDHQDPYGYFESWGISEDQLTHDINNGVDMNQLNSVVYSQRQ